MDYETVLDLMGQATIIGNAVTAFKMAYETLVEYGVCIDYDGFLEIFNDEVDWYDDISSFLGTIEYNFIVVDYAIYFVDDFRLALTIVDEVSENHKDDVRRLIEYFEDNFGSDEFEDIAMEMGCL